MADRNWDARNNHKRAPHQSQNEPAYERTTEPRQAVRDALDEEMRSRPRHHVASVLGRLQARLAKQQ